MRTTKTDQTGWMPRLIWVFAGRTAILLVLSRGGSLYFSILCRLHGVPVSLSTNIWFPELAIWSYTQYYPWFLHYDKRPWQICPQRVWLQCHFCYAWQFYISEAIACQLIAGARLHDYSNTISYWPCWRHRRNVKNRTCIYKPVCPGKLQYFKQYLFLSYYWNSIHILAGHGSSIGSMSAWHASGPEFDLHVRHILS